MKKLNNPAPPPTFEQLLEVFRRTTPKDFYEPLADRGDGTPTPSFSLFRGLARTFEKLALKATRSVEARYFLPSAIQRDEPASSGRPAQGYVDVRRVGQSTDALVIDPGRMRLEGPGGRFYVNADPVVWNPGDTATRRLLFVSEVEGFAGNLDHLADEAGLLDLDLVSIADQDLDRAATNGSILVPSGSVLQDSGIPDLFGPADVGLYARINAAANPANVGRQLRIVGFDWPQLEIPVGTGRYPRRVTLDDVERRNPIEVLLDDGGVVTDFYSEAVDELGTNDVPALPPVPAIGDAFYVATTAPFNKVSLRFDTPGDGDWTIAVRYWDGVAWVDVSDLDDPTNGLRPSSSGFYDVAWTLPADWAPVASPSGSGLVPYLLRFEVTGFVSVAQQPLLGRVVLHVPSPLIAEDASVTWSLLDFDTLGLELTRVEAFANGRDNDLYMLGDARGVYQQAGESDDVFRDRASRLAEVVSPLAIIRVVNRALRPYGYAGKAFDVTIDTTPDNSLAGAGPH